MDQTIPKEQGLLIGQFLKKYVPVLEEIEKDPARKKWCRNYSAYTRVTSDPYDLYRVIYQELMQDAYRNGIVTQYYPMYRELVRDFAVADSKAGPEQLRAFTDQQLLAILGMQIRSDYASNGSLMYRYVAEGLLLHYMKELQGRWFPKRRNPLKALLERCFP